MSESSSVKGILKKDPQVSPGKDLVSSGASTAPPFPFSHSPKHLKWDETNLAETEANKSATMKITEPKTPYVHNAPSDSISDEEQVRGRTIPKLSLGSDSEGGGSSTHFSSSCEWESSEEADLRLSPEGKLSWKTLCSNCHRLIERAKRKEQFRKMRKEHYRMKEAIRRGRALVKSESEASESDKDD